MNQKIYFDNHEMGNIYTVKELVKDLQDSTYFYKVECDEVTQEKYIKRRKTCIE